MVQRTLISAAAALLVASPLQAAEDTIKIGTIATLEGAFATLGQDGMRGVRMALAEFDGEIAGKEIELISESSNASPDSAVQAARKLVENDGVDIVVGPLSGSEGIALRDYSKTQPDVTFFNGASAAQSTTLREPSENFFRFSTDGAQWMAGLGEYVYEEKGWESVAVVAEDYSFPYSQVMGFLLNYCELGGTTADRFWVPIGTDDYSSIVYSIPDSVDAIYVALGGSDAVNFLKQYQQAGGQKPMIGGSITVDQSILSAQGVSPDYLVGTPSAGPIADNWDNPEWQAFVERYQERFPDGFSSPSLFAHGYYVNTLAALTGLEAVDGELGDHAEYREVVSGLELETPTGMVELDQNRQAVADMFVTQVAQREDGTLYNEVVKVVENVNQTLGRDREDFMALGEASRNNPSCD